MARKRTTPAAEETPKRLSTRDAMIAVLTKAKKPLPAAQLIKEALLMCGWRQVAPEGGGGEEGSELPTSSGWEHDELTGATPQATASAQLVTSNAKKDGVFVRVGKGVYDLRSRHE